MLLCDQQSINQTTLSPSLFPPGSRWVFRSVRRPCVPAAAPPPAAAAEEPLPTRVHEHRPAERGRHLRASWHGGQLLRGGLRCGQEDR